MRPALWILPFAACCSTAGTGHDRTPEQEQKYKEAAARGEVKLGMTPNEVRGAMGEPKRKGTTTYRGKRVTFWAYLYTDIYFDDAGLVVGWHSALG
jgi:hypothetical protein